MQNMDAIGTGVRFRNILTFSKRGISGIIFIINM